MTRRSGYESYTTILEAALEVFSKKGYARTTMKEVARRAGMSVGSVYVHFENKEQLYVELLSGEVASFAASLDACRHDEPVVAIQKYVHSYLDFAGKRMPLISTSLKEYDLDIKQGIRSNSSQMQRQLLTDIINRGIRDGCFTSVDPAATACLIMALLRGVVLAKLYGEIDDVAAYGAEISRMLMEGVGGRGH